MQPINIPLEIVNSGIDSGQNQMAEALQEELLAALKILLEEGRGQIIDVHSLPLEDGGRSHLKDLLGRGEISVTLDSMGRSDIYETAFSGIWWVCHLDAGEQIISEFIEVCWVPEIVKSQRADVQNAVRALEHRVHPDE